MKSLRGSLRQCCGLGPDTFIKIELSFALRPGSMTFAFMTFAKVI
jgi:hypothetical protein